MQVNTEQMIELSLLNIIDDTNGRFVLNCYLGPIATQTSSKDAGMEVIA